MTFEEQLKHLPPPIIWALFREKMLAQGRLDAFSFVQECEGQVACIKERLEWYEAKLSDPAATAKGQPYAPHSSVRLHADGHLAGLRDALKPLEQADGSPQPEAVSEPARTIAEGSTRYDTASEPTHSAPSESAPSATSQTTGS